MTTYSERAEAIDYSERTSTRVGTSGDPYICDPGLVFLCGHKGYYEWFNRYYDDYLRAMVESVSNAIIEHPEYKEHLVLIDTASFSKGHRNKYYGDGLHYGSGEHRDGIKRSPIVRDMMANAILNELCLRK